MTKKLVELDASTYYAKEIDLPRLKREAVQLKQFLTSVSDDAFGLREKVEPYCDMALLHFL